MCGSVSDKRTWVLEVEVVEKGDRKYGCELPVRKDGRSVGHGLEIVQTCASGHRCVANRKLAARSDTAHASNR